MILRPPIHPALRGLVRVVWHVAAPRTGRETILPAGVAQLLVNRAFDRLSWWSDGAHSTGGAALSGPFGRPFQIDTAEQADVVGAVFHPGGVAPFLERPTTALIRDHTPLNRLWHGIEHDIASIRQARTPQGALIALEALLVRRLRECGARAPDSLIRPLLTRLSQPRSRLTTIATQLGISRRTASRRFTDAVGLKPKHWTRIHRFQRSIGILRDADRVDLAEVAHRLGFADQAHFNHDFRALGGLTPTAYRDANGPWRNHLQVSPRDDSDGR